jgi:hypothetical protein
LGDIHSLSFNAFTDMPDCGSRTLTELRQFLMRVQKGEFGGSHENSGQSPAHFLTSTIDAFLASLDTRSRTIFMDRVGAINDPMTLMNVGQKYHMTRERVRQIIDLLTNRALQFGGPPFASCLQRFATELNREVLPLTPLLLTQLLETGKNPRYSAAFYIRLMGWLSKDLSVWPAGQTPAAYRIPKQEQVIQRLKQWFEGKTSPAKTMEAYQGISKADFQCTAFDFLEALKFAAECGINLEDPRNPLIQPPIAAPRRWARQLLSDSSSSSIPCAVLARAKAFLYSRRSPGSRYRLASVRRS